jgi:hypothetical protein
VNYRLNTKESLKLSEARDRLTRVWLIGTAVPAVTLIAQSILGKYGDAVREVWSWFIPFVVPTIALMVGILGGAAFGGREHRRVRRSFYEIALWLSIAYLVVLAMTIFLEPFSPTGSVALFAISSYWLTPFQGLVIGALGYLFTSETPDHQLASGEVPAQGEKPSGPQNLDAALREAPAQAANHLKSNNL